MGPCSFEISSEAFPRPHQLNRIAARFTQRRLARRAALAGGVGVAAALLNSSPRPLGAQGATTAPLPRVLEAYFAGWSAHDDGTQLAALFAAEGSLEDMPSGTVYQGRKEIAAYPAAFFAALSDLRFEEASGFMCGGWSAAMWTLIGTYTGTFPGLPPGTGQPIRLRGVDILELRDEFIQHVSSYYDGYAFLVQLGVLPAVASTPVT